MRKGSQWIKVLLIAVLAMAIMTPFIVHILAEENNSGRTADIFTVNGVSYSSFGAAVDALNQLPFDGSYEYVTMTIGSTEQSDEDIVVDISQAYSFYNSVRFISAEESTKLIFRRNQGYSGVLFELNLVNEATTGEQSEICLYFDGVGDSSSFTKPTITIDGNVSNTPVFSGDGYVSFVGAEFIRQGKLCDDESNVALEASDTTFIYLSDYTYGSLNYAIEDAEDGETISLIIGVGGPDCAVDFCAPVTIEDKIVSIECYYEEAYINVSCSGEPAITIGEYGGIKFGNEEEVMGSLHFLSASGDFIQCDGFIDSYMNLDYGEGEVCVGLDGYYYSVNGYNNVKFYIDFYSPIDVDIPDSGYYYYGDEFELQVLSHSGFSFMYWRSIYNETEYVDTSNYIVESSDKVRAEWYITDVEFASDLQNEYEITYGDELVLSLDLLCPAVTSGEATPYYTWKLTIPGSNPISYDSTSFSFTGMSAGTYSINCYCYVVGPDVEVSSDYIISEEATVTINKKDLTISPENATITYGDAAPTYSLQYDGFCFNDDSSAVSFLPSIGCDYTAGDDAGDYTISLQYSVAMPSSDNYNLIFEDGTLTVQKKTVEVPVPSQITYTYTGEEIILDIDTGEYCYVIDDCWTSVGTVETLLCLNDPDNYMWPDKTSEDITIYWTIEKQSIQVPVPTETTYVYTGSAIVLDVEIDDNITISGDEETNAGSHTATLSLLDPDSYQWADGTTADKQISWTITKAVVSFTNPQVTSFTYDGIEKTLQIASSNYYSVTNNTQTLAGSYTAIVSLLDPDNYQWSDNSSEDLEISWSISKAQVSIPSATTDVFTYDGNEKNIGIQETSYYTVTGTSATNAGSYSAVISLKDTSNYEWSDGTTTNKTIGWSIEKATISFTEPGTKTFTYDGTEKTLQIASSNYYSVTGNVGTNAGSYTATVSLADSTNYSWTDGSSEDISISWSIGKVSVTFTAPTTTTFTYTGSAFTLGITQSSYYTVSGNTQTNSGSYTAVVSLADKNNYQWSDNTTADKEISWSISKAQISIPSATTDVFTYDGSEKNLGIQETNDYSVTGSSGTNAGSYSAVISLKDTNNYEWTDGTTANKTIGWAIEKATVSFIEPETKTFTYDGTAKTLQVASSNYYSVTGNVQSNAGNYTATVSLTDKDNYTWEDSSSDDRTISWSIGKKQIEFVTPAVTTFTYSSKTTYLEVAESTYYTVTGNEQINAGTYTAIVSLSDKNNCEWSDGTTLDKEISWTINRLTVEFTNPEVTSFEYSGTEQTLQIAQSDYYTVSGNTGTNSGPYKAVISLADKDNFQWNDNTIADKEINWSIGKVIVQFTNPTETTFTYNSEEQGPEIESSNYYEIDGDASAVNAGSYSLTLSLVDKDNYTWADGSTTDKTITWTITKVQIDIPSVTTNLFTYDGEEKNLGIEECDYYTIDGDASAVNAGSYSLTLSLVDKDNYTWADGSTTDKTINWAVEKATVSFVEPQTKAFTYDGTEKILQIETSDYYSVTGSVQTNAGSYTATISLTDKDNYTWTDGKTEDITVSWSIGKASVEFTAPSSTTFTYTGSAITLGIAQSTYYTVSGNSETNSGSYTAVVSLADKNNYQWSDNTTADKEISWSITKVQIEIPSVEKDVFTYDGSEKNLGIQETNYYSVTGSSGTNAGSYSAVISLKDTNNYEWTDGTIANKTIGWAIEKATVGFAEPETKTFTYDGTAKTLQIASSNYYSVTGNVQTNAGNYTATVSLTDKDNYTWEDSSSDDITVSWSIGKKQIEFVAPSVTTFTYSSKTTYLEVAESTYYTVTGNEQINAGTYTAIVSLSDKNNCEWSDGTTLDKEISWTINRLTVEFTNPEVTSFEYSGTEQTLQIAQSDYYTVSGNTGTNSGPYKAVISLADKDNFQWSDNTIADKEINWSIGKVIIQFTNPTETTFTYNSEEQGPEIESSNYYEIDGDASAVNAGSYSLTVSLVDKDNYTWADGSTTDKTISWTVEKVTIGFTSPKTTSFTYDGTEKVLQITESDYFTVTGHAQTNAGSYQAIVSLKDKDNYQWNGETTEDITISWSIGKIEVSFEYPQNTIFRFDGQEKSLDIAPSNYYSVTGGSAVEVGSYTAVVSLLDKDNYVWNDETTEDKSIGWSIFQNRIPLNIPSVTTFTYNGKVKTLDIYSNEYYEVSGNTATNAGVYTATVTLINPNDYVWSDGSSDPVTINWSIEKAAVTFSEPTTKSYTYNGYEITFRVAENSNYTVSGNKATNVGEYSATISLKDKNNYCWSDGSSDPKTITWTIEKAKLVVTILSYTIEYNSDAPTYQYTARGLKGSDDLSSLGGTLYTVCAYSKGKPVGEYTISAQGLSSDNYEIEYVDGKLTVKKAQLEKPVVSLIEFTYDGKSHNVSEKYEGQLDVVCQSQTNVGTYTASLSIKDKTNYSWTDGTTEDISIEWKINKAKLVVTSSDVTIHYGEEPNFSAIYSGFAEGDSENSLTGSLSFKCSYEQILKAGEYSVMPEGLLSDNYDIEYVSGKLTVLKAKYDMSGIYFNDARFEYDGKEHTIEITGTLPNGVTVSYTPGNTFTEVGTYEITAVFSYDTENYEAIEDMKAVLRITNGFVGSEEYNRIVDEVLGTKSSHITNLQAKAIYENRITEFLNDAEQTDTIEELEGLRDEFLMFLDGFVIDLKFVPLSVFKEQYYDGDVIETGFNLVGSMYYEYDVVFIVDYDIRYMHGSALTKGDTQFVVYCSELDTVIEIPEVLDESYNGLSVYPEYDYNAKYVAGKTLPTLTGTAYDSHGYTVKGEFSWVGNGVIRAGSHSYTYKFVPDGETKAVYGTIELTAEKGNSKVESVKLADETTKLKYGDPLPELTCISNVPGKISLDLGQVLTAGTKEYNFTFTPDSSDYNPCQGKVLIEVEKATLFIRARDLIIYQGDTPLFTFIYEGFVNVESSLLLKQTPVIKNIPTEIGVYTVIPEGVETENYVVVYEESKFIIKSNSYAAEIKDNNEELVSSFKIDDNVNLQVKTAIEGFNTEAFNKLLSESGFYMDKEELKYMYEMKITDDKGNALDVDTVILLNVPSNLKGYCLHLFAYDGEKYEQYINYEIEDGKIYLHLKGSTSVCISAVKEDDVIDYITQLIMSSNIKSDEVWKIKVYYDLLSENGKQKLSSNVVAALSNLFTASSGKLSFNIADNNITMIKGLENVITKELLDELVDQIDVSLISDTTQLSSTAKEKLRSQGMSVVKALEIALYKTVTRTAGENKNSLTELIDNNDINGNLRIYIPMTGDMSKYSNLNVAYVNEQGEVIVLDSSVEEIDGQYYLVFDTDHFSTYAVIGTPVSSVSSRDRVMMSWIIILSFALAVCAVLVIGGVIKKKSEKGAD